MYIQPAQPGPARTKRPARASEGLVDASPAWTKTLTAVHEALCTTNLPMLTPLLIWVLTAFYRTDWLSSGSRRSTSRT